MTNIIIKLCIFINLYYIYIYLILMVIFNKEFYLLFLVSFFLNYQFLFFHPELKILVSNSFYSYLKIHLLVYVLCTLMMMDDILGILVLCIYIYI